MSRWTESRPERPYDWAANDTLTTVPAGTLAEAVATYRQDNNLPRLNATELLDLIDKLEALAPRWTERDGRLCCQLTSKAQRMIRNAPEAPDDFPSTMRRSGPQIAAAICLILFVAAAVLTLASIAGANDLDCRPVITGPYADYDDIAAVTLTVPDYCPSPQQVRLVVFSLPAGVTALTAEAADADQTPISIVDATLEPGVPNTLDPGLLSGCGDLQIDVAPNNADWAALELGVVAPHNLPGAITASAEHADDQCKPCTFAVPVPDMSASVEPHDDAPCGVRSTADSAHGGQTGPDSKGVPVLSAATSDVTSPTPQADVASSEAETTAPPLTAVSASAAPTAVEAAYVELPNTGIDIRWVLGIAILATFVGWLLILIGPDIFHGKEKRS